VPERAEGRSESFAQQIRSVVPIYRDRMFWRLAPLLALTGGTHIAILTLWAGPWFRDVAGLDRMAVANHLMVMAIGFLVGILSSGVVADWLGRRGVDLLTVMLGFLALFFVAQLAVVLQVTSLTLPIWFLFGMFGQVAVLAYPWLSSHYGATLSGRTNTAVNLLLFLSAFAVQYAIGAIIDLFPVTASGYSPDSYRWAFGVFLALQLLSLIWYLAGRGAFRTRADAAA
jgi:predicted MFS family arabinose efflux permease